MSKYPPFSLSKLPSTFLKFLQINEIDPAVYTIQNLPRYIRLNSYYYQDEHSQLQICKELEEQIGSKIWPVKGIDGFFGLDGNCRIVNCKAYKEGKIFGIDLSSGIAVYALDIHPNEHILDLCCAPGAKLCMISNILGTKGCGTITGVDISRDRASTCRSLLKKYKISRARLFVADGTTFNVPAPSFLEPILQMISKDDNREHYASISEEIRNKSKNYNKTNNISNDKNNDKSHQQVKPFWAPKILRNDPQINTLHHLYDKVIVDAECTHDGSIMHILKYEKYGWDKFEKNFLNSDRINSLWDLQRNLLKNGWTLLKPGGILVYSTCSLSHKQNEDVIGWFLSHYPNSKLEPIPNINHMTVAPLKESIYSQVDISNAVRFDPIYSNTSGFFVARIRKKLSHEN